MDKMICDCCCSEDCIDSKIITITNLQNAMNKGFNPFIKDTKLLSDTIKETKCKMKDHFGKEVKIDKEYIRNEIFKGWQLIVNTSQCDWLLCKECLSLYSKV